MHAHSSGKLIPGERRYFVAGGVDFACCPPHLLVHGDGAPVCVCVSVPVFREERA